MNIVRTALIFVCIVGLGAGFFACGTEVSSKAPIKVKLLADLSGPTNFVGQSFHAGRVDLIAELNAAGGIRGHMIEYEEADMQYDASSAVEQYLLWKSHLGWNEVVTVFGYGTPDALALQEYIKSAEMPFFTLSSLGSLASPRGIARVVYLEDGTPYRVENPGAPFNYMTTMDYSSSVRAAIDYIGRAGTRTITFVRCSNNRYCTDPVEVGTHYASGKYNIEVQDDLIIELSDSPATIQAKARDYLSSHNAPDWFWLGTIHDTSAMVIEALSQVPKVKFMANVWSFDEGMDEATHQTARGKLFGVAGAKTYGDFQAASVMSDLVSTYNRFHQGGEWANVFYVTGYASVALWSIAVERLIAGGQEISRKNLKQALDSMKSINTGGLLMPITFSPEDHRPTMSTEIYSIDLEGRFLQVATMSIERQENWLGW